MFFFVRLVGRRSHINPYDLLYSFSSSTFSVSSALSRFQIFVDGILYCAMLDVKFFVTIGMYADVRIIEGLVNSTILNLRTFTSNPVETTSA